MKGFAGGLLVLSVLLGSQSAWAAAPAPLMNKSISVSASVHTPATGTDGSRSSSRTVQVVFYVSSQGRVFTRADHAGHHHASHRQKNEEGPGTKLVQFSGGAIHYTAPLVSGAAQLRVTFDPAFQSCTANILIAGENGKPVTYVGFNGVKYTTTGKPQINSVSCSIRDGNALAN